VAEELRGGPQGVCHRWRAGGILAQFLPRAPERMRQPDLDPGDPPAGIAVHAGQGVIEDDAWVESRALVETVEDLELIDPAISSERLLYRLFHERGVRVFRSASIQARCSCSREGVANMLTRFSRGERQDMAEDGMISVTCEFCNRTYRFAPSELDAAD